MDELVQSPEVELSSTSATRNRVLSGSTHTPQIRHAAWRIHASLPLSLSSRIRRFPWRSFGFGLMVIAVFCLLETLFHRFHIGWVGNFLSTGAAFVAVMIRYLEPPKDVLEMLDVPSDEPQFPVSIEVFVSNVKVGRDRGIITFTGNLMHFEGKSTSFGLPLKFQPNGDQKVSKTALALPSGDFSWGGGSVSVFPYFANGRPSPVRTFFAAVRTAAAADSPSPEFLVLPPNSPQPQLFMKLRKSVRICRMIAIGSCIAIPVAILFARLESSSGGWVVAVICSLFALIFKTASADNKRHIAKLQSLAHPSRD